MSVHTSPSPRLPIEVIERIIDSVYDLVYQSASFFDLCAIWKALSLTCHAMVPRSQLWLFRDIWLRSEVQALKLAEVLRGNAAVAPRVQKITLSGPLKGEDGRGYTWISWVPLVFAPQMKNLEELQVQGDIFRDGHAGLPQALTAFRSIHRLILYKVSFPSFGHCTQLVRAFPHLRHLTFDNVSWIREPPSPPDAGGGRQRCTQRKRVALAHLVLAGDELNIGLFVKWLLDVKATKSLVSLYEFTNQFQTIRDVTVPNKSTICTMVLSSVLDSSIEIPVNSLDSLRTIHLRMATDTFPVKLLTSITLAVPRQLQEVKVYIRIKDQHVVHDENSDELAAYARVDVALCKPALSGLSLNVCLYGRRTSIEATDWWQRKLAKRLPVFCSGVGRLVMSRMVSNLPLLRWLADHDGF